MKKFFLSVLSVILVLALGVPSFGVSIAVKSIKLNSTGISLKAGKTYDLKVTISPDNASNKKLIFTSDNSSIATVDKNGKVKAVKAGKTVITVTSSSNSKIKAKCKVTVTKADKVKLTFWQTYGDVEDPFFTDTVIPLFEEKNPNIEIESVRQDGGQFNQLITTSFATKQTPDVARIDIISVAAYAKQGGIIPLDNMEGFKDLKEKCLVAPVSTNLYEGKYFGLPLDTNCKAAVMNMDFMKTLGFTAPPKTMEEIIAAAKKNSPGKYVINVSGVGDWDLYPYFTLFGGVVANADYTKVKGYMDSKQSIAALQKMIDLHKDKVLTIRDIDGTPDAWADITKKDGYGMFFEGPWYFSSNPKYKDSNITPALIPTYKGKSSSVVGGEDIVIFKNSKHPKEAFKFIQFMLSKQVQLLMASKGQMPVLKSAVESNMINKDPVFSIYQKQLESASIRIPSPQSSAISQHWSDEVMKALKGDATAEAALKAAAKEIEAELDK